MKYVLRFIVAAIVCFFLWSCSSDNWDNMIRELSNTDEITATIHTNDFPLQQTFVVDNRTLAQLLEAIEKETVEQPTTEQHFEILVSDTYKITVFDHAVVFGDSVRYRLTDENRSALQLLYETRSMEKIPVFFNGLDGISS